VCDLIREKGNVPNKEMRSLLKEYKYDRSSEDDKLVNLHSPQAASYRLGAYDAKLAELYRVSSQ